MSNYVEQHLLTHSASSMALSRRLCTSCLSISLSDILPGKSFYFDAESLPGRGGCNLCAFFRGLHACHDEMGWVAPLNAEGRKMTPMRAIEVKIVKLDRLCEGHLCNPIVVETSITDAWHGHRLYQKLYFRDPSPGRSCMFEKPLWYIPGVGVLSTWADLSLARKWLRECLSTHADCQPIDILRPASILHPSTRFVDVQLGRVVELDEIFGVPIEYIALSYVWGKGYHLRTTSRTIQQFKRHLSVSWDAANKVPKTIQDAMTITHRLGYRFLWVDALCIVQDLPYDFAVQLAQMDRIYSLAAATIVARGSTSSDSGIPGVSLPRNVINGSYSEIMIHDKLSAGFWDPGAFERYGGNLNDNTSKEFYIWRGWTFQEQILSTRNLEFGPKHIRFSCGRRSKPMPQEVGYLTHPYLFEPGHPYYFRYSLRRFERTKAGHLDKLPPVTSDSLVYQWTATREFYSKMSFSYPIDRRNAIMGTAKMFQRVISGCIDSGGHARDEPHHEVLWYLENRKGGYETAPPVSFPPDPAPEGMFPSWSWLGLWPVAWSVLTIREPYPGVSLRISGSSEFTNDSLLEIEGPVIELQPVGAADEPEGQKLSYLDGTLVNAKLLLDAPLAAGIKATCVPIARDFYRFERTYYGLLLLRFEGPYYLRIGLGAVPIHDSKVFEERVNSKDTQRKLVICR
jgi:hypothetical protein